jgi:hypothetical protein
MTRGPRLKSLTGAEKKRLRRELEQMWSTVPEHALPKARQLAGVQTGKECEFRTAVVQEQNGAFAFETGKEGAPCTAELPQPDIEIKFWLSGDTTPYRSKVSYCARLCISSLVVCS